MPHRSLTEPWWTPWPGSGPGRDPLGDIGGLTVVELGCGNGHNAAAFAYGGATVTGIDRNPTKIEQARRRWPGVPRLRFEHAEASAYLAVLTVPVEVVCSIFGALSFNPTGPLLDSIATRLRPGGRLAIAARTPPEEPQIGQRRTGWATYAHSLDVWRGLLAAQGLRTTMAEVLDHPTDPDAAGCVILVGER